MVKRMSDPSRLFLFAGYDQNSIVNDAMVYYVSCLSKYGDVIVCVDNDLKNSEIQKLNSYTIHTIAQRHGEYDFGSYKRGYEYARNKNILKNYDIVYLVNDSVFGPLFDIKETLQNMEALKTDAAGIVISQHKTHKFMESWFIRLNKKIFTSAWFDKFISTVTHENAKYIITVKYEHGLTNLITNNGCSWDGLYKCRGRFTYNKPKQLFKMGCPFVKKASFTRHNGAAGSQIKYILNHTDKKPHDVIIKTANYTYGNEYMKQLLTSNPFKTMLRNLKYLLQKYGR